MRKGRWPTAELWQEVWQHTRQQSDPAGPEGGGGALTHLKPSIDFMLLIVCNEGDGQVRAASC